MKKILFLVVLLCSLLVSTNIVFADKPNLSNYSDDEISELIDLLQEEIIKRHLEKTAILKKGDYLVGRDIPAGKYIYTNLSQRDDSWPAYIYIYTDNTKENVITNQSVPKEGTVFISIEDGNIFSSDEDFSLTISFGALFK